MANVLAQDAVARTDEVRARPPRLLFLNNQGLGTVGGGVTILKALVRDLESTYRITVASFDPPTDGWAGIEQHTLPSPPPPRTATWRFQPLQRARHNRRAVAALAGAPWDLAVVLDCQFVWAVGALDAAGVVYLSPSCIPRQEWLSRLRPGRIASFLQYVYLERTMVRRARQTIVSSLTHAREMRRYELLPGFQPCVLYPALPLPALQDVPPREARRSGELVVATVGRLTPVKNFGAVVALAGRLRDLPCHFVIAGSGDDGALRRAIAAAGLEDRVELLGAVADVPGLLARADVLVHPSHYESFGIAVFEAMCAGVPVVCARPGRRTITAMSEYVCAGESGLFVDFDRPDEAAAAVRALLADGERRRRMGAAARAAAETLARHDYVGAVRDLLHEVAAGTR